MQNRHQIEEISTAIKEEALRLGFTDCGFSRAGPLPEDASRLRTWLESGHHAEMIYMAHHFEKRTDPTQLVKGVKSIISVLYNYYTDRVSQDPEAPVLSKYTYGKDYHFVIKDKLKLLFDFIRNHYGNVSGRIFVDSAPVLDRAWARKAGLGWIGKNSNLISRKAGSFVFIGEIILDLELVYNEAPESDFCGSCNRCIEACPTDAILNNCTLDAERCISYQTIENRGEIPAEYEGRFANRLFGCDICQDVCPWNRKALNHLEPAFEPNPDLLEMDREAWSVLDKHRFNGLFRHSAVQRAGYNNLKRNIAFLQKK